jgi:Fe2+ or Zn2+ uptake regulation protein
MERKKENKHVIKAEQEIIVKKIPFTSYFSSNTQKKIEWLALSLGLVNEGESRQGITAVLYALIHGLNLGTPLTIEEIKEKASKIKQMSIKTVYYHVKRLKDIGIVNKVNNAYILCYGDEPNLYNALLKFYKNKFNEIMQHIETPVNSLQQDLKQEL